jgi:hypothetical protein
MTSANESGRYSEFGIIIQMGEKVVEAKLRTDWICL